MKKNKLENAKKYTINNYINGSSRKLIQSSLDISQPTFSRKSNVLVGEKNGFELCQLKKIADILEREIMELLTIEAKQFYGFININLGNHE